MSDNNELEWPDIPEELPEDFKQALLEISQDPIQVQIEKYENLLEQVRQLTQ